jgi:hypothetical protein
MRDITSFGDELARQNELIVDANRFIWRTTIAPLLSAELIEEHRRDPVGRHSPALEKVLDFVRGNPVPDALPLVLLTVVPGREWAIAEYPPPGEIAPRVRPATYASRAEAEHDIFLERLTTIEAGFGPAGGDLGEQGARPGGSAG